LRESKFHREWLKYSGDNLDNEQTRQSTRILNKYIKPELERRGC
jgi:hypothetical protein